MIGNILKKIFGTRNDREIKRIRGIAHSINALESEIEKLTDDELKNKTSEFKQRLENGETLDDILVEAFAVVREASKRVLGMRQYDVQLIGGIVLHEGKITEMKTGEGKTLVATAPVYLNALSGKGVHIITVNDYLARRDKELMGRIYTFLGLSSDVLLNGMEESQRKEAYLADITYGTNSEFGFDYLRDNMVSAAEDKVQRHLNYCIVDEVDSILIDEARTPLIISGSSSNTTKWYPIFCQVAFRLDRSYETENIKDVKLKKEMNIPDEKWGDYEVDEKSRNIVLTEKGIKKVEQLLNLENLYSPENVELTHYLNQALKAKELFVKDRDYLIRENEIIIIDEFTGRAMEGRRYSDGLHQAIEAKEGVNVAGENQTLASITLQNYFRMYEKISGMTGTAETEATEFMHTYGLEVVVIPTNKPVQRKDLEDLIFRTKREKINAIIDRIVELYEKGQPVLVGTVSIKSSEELSEFLKERNIPHNVLNAKLHEKEAEIIAQAGRYKAVTIATNMAGRGTDIMLGGNPEFRALAEAGSIENVEYPSILAKYVQECEEEKKKVIESGGLFILGTERHESRRIDNQLRGRAGRQGDPGTSEFYLSLDDDLLRLFISERALSMMNKIKMEDGEAIQHPMINRAIENAQKKVESRNFGIRKNLLEFDDVMNKQREAIYASRNEALEKDDLKQTILSMLRSSVSDIIVERFVGEYKDEWDITGVRDILFEKYGYEIEDMSAYKSVSVEEYVDTIYKEIEKKYEIKEEEIGSETMRKVEKYVLFEVVDTRWREHLKGLDALREGIYLRSYGQKDPIVEYKLISGDMYARMLSAMKIDTTSYMFKIVEKAPEEAKEELGDDAPCKCGSGKLYSKCCGRV